MSNYRSVCLLKGAIGGTILSVTTTFIVALGQMTTPGSVKSQKLPPAPMDSCPAVEVFAWINNVTLTGNDTAVSAMANISTTIASLTNTFDSLVEDVPEP